MFHIMRLDLSPFNMIISGEKTIELRLNDNKRKQIKTGDTIQFIYQEMKVNCIVKNLYYFPSFVELYNTLPLLKCGYTKEDISKASASDMDCYYSKEEQSIFGVVGIELICIL